MKNKIIFQAILIFVASSASAQEPIAWQSWSPDVFKQAQKEKKLVLLDLEAVWCHWCHVMHDVTYTDAAVISRIRSKFIAIRVDQDARPDLSKKYEDYGWPATIIFSSEGEELVKLSGFIEPAALLTQLEKTIKSPTPLVDVKSNDISETAPATVGHGLAKKFRSELISEIKTNYDSEKGSWDIDHKFLDASLVEWLLSQAHDSDAEKMAKQTLEAGVSLLDPAWGGVYQYSTGKSWNSPHFEKIMELQTENIKAYSESYLHWRDPRQLSVAKQIAFFMEKFLTSPEGAFYTSQDADLIPGKESAGYFKLSDSERRKLGIPRVDRHSYSRENGWAISALISLYAASGDERYLESAKKAAEWVLKNRMRSGGGFRHDDKDSGGPYLGDTLAMGRAFLSLYGTTGERKWLSQAEQACKAIGRDFFDTRGPGFLTAHKNPDDVLSPVVQPEENIAIARYANLLFRYSGNADQSRIAHSAFAAVSAPRVAEHIFRAPGVLLADVELNSEPVHITIVGAKEDPAAFALFKAAIAYPTSYKRIDWLDRKEGPLPNETVKYPDLSKAAAFACAKSRCSLPATQPEQIRDRVDRMMGKHSEKR